MMLRSQSEPVSSKASPKTSTSSQTSPTSRANSSVNKNIDVTELANTLLPLLSQAIQESVAANINAELRNVNDCITENLSQINEKLNIIGATHERIETELAGVVNSVAILRSNHEELTQKVINLEDTLDKNSEEVAVAQSSITSLLQEQKILEHELDSLKKTCVTQTNLEERVVEKVSQMLQTQQQNHLPCTVNDLPLREISFDVETECRLEAMEQYSRRDCLLFFGLYEMEFEDCTEKIVQTAHAMGVNITAADVSISHRLQIRTRRRDEPRPIIAKFTRRSVKIEVFESKHRLKESLNHYNVNVQEQLTKARSRAIYRMKEAGIRVSTFESRLLYTHDGKHGVINSLAELPSKLGWDRAKMKEIFAK